MKKLLLCLSLFVATSSLFAQQGINYKAIVTDNGTVLQNQTTAVLFTISNESSQTVYQESHVTTTDANGIIILVIGEGTQEAGNFNTIDWSSGKHFLKTEINGTDMGTTEFNSVPYAKYAENGNGAKNIDELSDAKSNGNSIYIGANSGNDSTISQRNVVLGSNSGQSITTGENNIIIGENSATLISSGSNNVIIGGIGSYYHNNATENTLLISNGSQPLIEGRFESSSQYTSRGIDIIGSLQVQYDATVFEKILKREDSNTDMLAYTYGYINADGSKMTESSSTLFSVLKTGTGKYRITFTNIYNLPDDYKEYIVTATRGSAGFIWVDRFNNYFEVSTTNASGNLADRGFSFVVFKK